VGERLELFADFALGSVKCGKEDAAPAFEIVGDDRTVVQFKAQRRFDQPNRHFEQLFGERGTSSSTGSPQCPSSIACVNA